VLEALDELNDERERNTKNAPSINFKEKLKEVNQKINTTEDPKKLEKLLQEKLVILIHSEIPVRRAMDY